MEEKITSLHKSDMHSVIIAIYKNCELVHNKKIEVLAQCKLKEI